MAAENPELDYRELSTVRHIAEAIGRVAEPFVHPAHVIGDFFHEVAASSSMPAGPSMVPDAFQPLQPTEATLEEAEWAVRAAEMRVHMAYESRDPADRGLRKLFAAVKVRMSQADLRDRLDEYEILEEKSRH